MVTQASENRVTNSQQNPRPYSFVFIIFFVIFSLIKYTWPELEIRLIDVVIASALFTAIALINYIIDNLE